MIDLRTCVLLGCALPLTLGCYAGSEAAADDEVVTGTDEPTDSVEQAYTYYKAPPCVNYYLKNGMACVTNTCTDAAHPRGYTIRYRIYSSLGPFDAHTPCYTQSYDGFTICRRYALAFRELQSCAGSP